MTEIQKELDIAFRLLSAIPVNGDSVELMSEVKARLRKAFGLCEPAPQEERGQDG